MTQALRFQYNDASLLKMSRQLEKIPARLRERLLKKAIKNAMEIFDTKVKRNISNLRAAGRDRWSIEERRSYVELDRHIRKKTERSTTTRVGGRVDIHSKTDLAKTLGYAASVEYGHTMIVFGRKIEGGKVPEHQYWRPAMTASEAPVERLILRELKRLTKELFTT